MVSPYGEIEDAWDLKSHLVKGIGASPIMGN
jgi:hypothetical protein